MRIRPDAHRTRYIFDRVKSLWPSEINIQDSECIENAAYPTPAFAGTSYVFPALSKAWDEAEDSSRSRGFNVVEDIGVWVMFCVLHAMAIKAMRGSRKSIFIWDARMARFDFELQRNLIDKSWENERKLYLSTNLERHSYRFTQGCKNVFSEFEPHYRKNK